MNQIDLEKLENIQEEVIETKKAGRKGIGTRIRKHIRGCDNGKRTYKSKKEAKHVRTVVSKKENKKLRIYKCLDCGHWHLTSRKTYRAPKEVKQSVDN